MTHTEAAYLAGLVDGEGCICLHVDHPERENPTVLVLRLCVANTSLMLLESLTATFGVGTIQKIKRYSPKHKQGYEWRVYGKRVQKLLHKILPYLRLKRRQANLILSIDLTIKNRGRCSPAEKRKRTRALKRIRVLNRKGVL